MTSNRLAQGVLVGWAILAVVILSGCDVSAALNGTRSPLESPSIAVSAADATLVGRVVSVADGDTLTVVVGGHEVRIRLAEIDAPERGQPWAARSRDTLRSLVDGQTVQIFETDRDRWGRVVGRVYLDGRDVNAELVQSGAAWAFLRYQTDPRFSAYQADARQRRVGLWSLPDNETIAPWEWRAGQRVGPAIQSETQNDVAPMGLIGQGASQPSQGSEFRCGERQFCRQMRSCEEARFHLQQCGVGTIDGDGDGIPCEALCQTRPGLS